MYETQIDRLKNRLKIISSWHEEALFLFAVFQSIYPFNSCVPLPLFPHFWPSKALEIGTISYQDIHEQNRAKIE